MNFVLFLVSPVFGVRVTTLPRPAPGGEHMTTGNCVLGSSRKNCRSNP